MESKSFYRNLFLLTQVIPPTNDFKKYFKEGMFDKPNTVGFIHISHYLFTIYDEERFKKAVDWPIIDKKDEGKYRNEIRDFMNTIANENSDFEFKTIQPSHLHTASGARFINLMWKFSTIVMRTYLRRQGKETLYMAPKSGDANILTKNLLTNMIADKKKEILIMHNKITETENRAEIEAKELIESISNSQKQWFEIKQKLEETVANAAVHPDIKKRLADPNDTEIIQLWKDNLKKGLRYVKTQQNLLCELMKKSENVAAIVNSVITSDSNCLDASNLPKINTEKLKELNYLKPETQVAVHHLYEDNNLHLSNLLHLLKSLLQNLRDELILNPLPDFTDCNMQVEASTQDLRKMQEILDLLHSKVTVELPSKMREFTRPPMNPHMSLQMDPEVFNSIVLKSSPKIHLNPENNLEIYDAAERLELTPVENVHKSLFLRYKNDTPTIPRPLKAPPKSLISRINFDDSISSTLSDKSPAKLPIKLFSQLSTSKTSKFSRLFTSSTRKNLNNYSVSSTATSAYNVSDLKSHFGSQKSLNLSREFTSINSTPEKQKRVVGVDKPAFNSTEIVHELSTINENQEIKITVGASPRVEKPGREEKRRVSIGDLVEKFKKLREQSANVTYLEHSGDNSDESCK